MIKSVVGWRGTNSVADLAQSENCLTGSNSWLDLVNGPILGSGLVWRPVFVSERDGCC